MAVAGGLAEDTSSIKSAIERIVTTQVKEASNGVGILISPRVAFASIFKFGVIIVFPVLDHVGFGKKKQVIIQLRNV